MHPEALSSEGKRLFPRLTQFQEFVLAGGTALALQIGHRVSVDFDLFFEGTLREQLLNEVKRTFPHISLAVSVNNPEELTIFVGETKLTFLAYPFPTLLGLTEYKGVKLFSVSELAAMKAYTIGRRGSYRDYVDLYAILLGAHTSINEIIDLAQKKYTREFNARLFLEQLVYLDDVEETRIQFLGESIDKRSLQTFFESQVKTITL